MEERTGKRRNAIELSLMGQNNDECCECLSACVRNIGHVVEMRKE